MNLKNKINSILVLLKKHYAIIILAVVVGSLTAFPQVLAFKNFSGFQGIFKYINNDETYYLARARDILDGHYFLGNPYFFEHKNELPMETWLPDNILTQPLALLGVNMHYGYMFYDFFLTFVLTILTYSIVFLISKNRLVSFLSAAFLHLNIFFFVFGRSPSPQLNFIFWLLLYLFWFKFIINPNKFTAVLVAFIFGLMFYIYTYYWVLYAVFFCCFLFLNFILKKNIPYKLYGLIFLLTALISLPYWFILWHNIHLPYYAETVARVGMITTHFPSGRKIVMWGVLLLILSYLAFRKKIIKIDSLSLLLISGIIAPIIAVNEHIITGKNLQFSSHFWMSAVFLFVFLFAYLSVAFFSLLKTKKIKILIVLLFCIFIFSYPLLFIVEVARGDMNYTELEKHEQRYAPVIAWLNKNTNKDDVIFADDELSGLIPIYTSDNVFFHAYGLLHFMSNREGWDRLVLNNYWNTFDEKYVIDNNFAVFGAYYTTKYDHEQTKNSLRKLFHLPLVKYNKFPETAINEFLTFAKEVQSYDFGNQLNKYRVDYLIWDKKQDTDWQIDKLNFLTPVYNINEFVIYKIDWQK